MAIIFHESERLFHLTNDKISYIFQILENGKPGHLYYGPAIKDRVSFSHMLQIAPRAFATVPFEDDLSFSEEILKSEYPSYGTGDFRDPAYKIREENGSRISDFRFDSWKIEKGKKILPGLPSFRGNKDEAETLTITFLDSKLSLKLELEYTIFHDYRAIIRSSRFTNEGSTDVHIERALSLSIDFYDSDYELLTLDGAWIRERHITDSHLRQGVQSVSSTRGSSSHFHNPFFALKRPSTTENQGDVYGFSLIYSGNFLAQVEVDSFDVSRAMIGINPFDFEWKLTPGETFQTPEAVTVWSGDGLNGMSQTFHGIFRDNLMRSPWRYKVRPILINNWEATYFDFTEKKILSIASKAKEVGIELFVLDDGWFGKRNDDTSSLGDWFVNRDKIPSGIDGLSKKVRELGLDFGLWIEPEMINIDSELYKSHPEWVIASPERDHVFGRHQLVLDYSNPDVVDHIYKILHELLFSSEISYIKWDMNRNITNAYGFSLEKTRQKEFFHRYILGVYDLYDRLTTAFPDVLFESCSGGGGRFDPGILCYAPQTWTSDDTDAVERLPIQYGTSIVYPIASMGSHVSAAPNHQMGRNTSLKMRGDVAYFGTFGYELDITRMTDDELLAVSSQIEFFKRWRETIQLGSFYRLLGGKDGYWSWMSVSDDKKKAVLGYYKVLAHPNGPIRKIQLKGLEPNGRYWCEELGHEFYGDELMNFGLILKCEDTVLPLDKKYENISYQNGTDYGDFTSQLYTFTLID